jgi:penicillin-binding protein 1C
MKFFNLNKNTFAKLNPIKQLKMGKKRPIFKLIMIWGAYGLLGFCLVAAFAFAWFSKDLPTPSRIANTKTAESTKFYDRTGTILLYETGEQKRTVIKNDQISQYLKDATVSIEDTKFYQHHGINYKAIASALYEKITGKRQVTRGGSTITQQYVKNALVGSDRSITRKIKEAILAVELEFMYNKEEILTMYLNQIPYGNATAGAEAAAKLYYGKTAKDLTLAEAATMAAIPNAPSYYSPYGAHVICQPDSNSPCLISRRNYVLGQMVKTGKITQVEADEAKKVDTTTVGVAVKPRKDSILAPHFVMYVQEQIADQFGEDKIQKEGLTIITTLDYDKQKIAQDAITNGITKVNKYGGNNAALVAEDPKNGQILAMIGSKDYFDSSIDGNVNITDSVRQPGSSFKPFTYATAFKKPEYSPSKILYDFETDFGGSYIPHNYNGRSNGPLTIRYALGNSLNIPAVKTMALVGMDNVIRTAEDMGITTLTDKKRYGLSLALGVAEVKPVEMANAYSVFANGGTKHDTTPILKVTDANKKVLYDFDKNKAQEKQVLDPQIAYEISSILSDNPNRAPTFGARGPLVFNNRTVASKTGTTNDFRDAWTVGYTPSISVAIWTGNNSGKLMKGGADGSVVAAPIFHEFIEKSLANVPNEEFIRPPQIQELTVEKYSNKLPSEYSKDLTKDIFAEWQIPKDKDDLHKVINVCKGTNKIAPEGTSTDLIEQKMLTDLHSEKPDNPSWEGPVRAWAQANGMIAEIPTETCDPASMTPSVSITSPLNSATLSGQSTISLSVQSLSGIKSVELFIDGVSIGQLASPYSVTYNFSSLQAGSHKILAIVTNDQGFSSRDEIPVLVSMPINPVISLGSIKISALSTDINWTTDRKTTGKITYHFEGGLDQQKNDNFADTTHKTTLISLKPNTKYYFSVTATDENGKSDSVNGDFTTSLNSEVIDQTLGNGN